MTLTTVGYGDLSPSTFPGKLIGKKKKLMVYRFACKKYLVNNILSKNVIFKIYLLLHLLLFIWKIGGLCALGGIFILTLPIPIVVNSFASYYKNRLWRNEVAYKKRQRARKRKEMELLMRDNLLNILTVPGTIYTFHIHEKNICVNFSNLIFNIIKHMYITWHL